MGKFLHVRLMLCFCLCFQILFLCAQEKQYRPYSIAFYNVENLFDTVDNTLINDEEFLPGGENVWTTNKYKEKQANIASVISQLGHGICADGISVLGISEIENDTVLKDLISHPLLRGRNYGIVHRDSPDKRGIDVALIYNKDHFSPLNVKSYPVDIEALGSSRPTRDVLLVSGKLGDETIHFTVNHWPSRGGGEKKTAAYRNLAAQVNRHIVDSLLRDDPQAHIVIMGDMNDNTDDESVKVHLRGKLDKVDTGPNDLYNPYHTFHKEGIGTTAYRDRWSLFDQILVSASFLDDNADLKLYKASIYNEKFLIQAWGRYKGYPFRTFSGDIYQGGYSDHFPVVIYLLKSTGP